MAQKFYGMTEEIYRADIRGFLMSDEKVRESYKDCTQEELADAVFRMEKIKNEKKLDRDIEIALEEAINVMKFFAEAKGA